MPYNLDVKGYMYESELKVIEVLAKSAQENGVIVEVGSYCGRSTMAWVMSCDPSVTIYCFDPFYEHLQDDQGNLCNTWEEFQFNTKNFKNIIPVRGTVPDQIGYTDSRLIDIFFIDAAHKNPEDWNIIQHFLPFVKPGGIVAGHDYSPYLNEYPINFPDVNLNVHRLEEMFNQKAKVTTTLWYLIKP